MLLPSRRLHLGGTSSQWIALYAICVWAMAFLLVVRPIAARFLVPILIVAYLAPFVAAPDRIRAIVRRGPGGPGGSGGRAGRGEPPRPPMKNVTPPDDPTRPG